MNCPNDGCEIEVREAEFHIGLVCPECKGIWLPKRYVDSLCMSYSIDVDELLSVFELLLSAGSGRSCPDCEESFVKLSYAGLSLDYCKPCQGIWFNAGELLSLEQAILRDDKLEHQQQHWFDDAVVGVFKDLVKSLHTSNRK